MKRLVSLLALAGLSACGGEIAPDCGDDAILLNPDDGYAVQAYPFQATWSAQTGLMVGPSYTFAVPYDIDSWAATVEVDGRQTGFAEMTYEGTTWIDGTAQDGTSPGWYSEPYYHWGSLGGSVAMPITPTTLPDGGGCLEITPAVMRNASASGTLYMMSRRGEPRQMKVDLNAILVGNPDVSTDELQASIDRASEIWSGGNGPVVGEFNVFHLSGNSVVGYNQAEQYRATKVDGAPEKAVNLIIFDDFSNASGVLGVAAGIPGPIGVQGLDGAGVLVTIDGHRRFNGDLLTDFLGETIAHEVGHQMGLFHTTESDGSRLESLDDTPACPMSQAQGGEMYPQACRNYDGKNFMFWVAWPGNQDEVSPSQAQVITRTPIAY